MLPPAARDIPGPAVAWTMPRLTTVAALPAALIAVAALMTPPARLPRYPAAVSVAVVAIEPELDRRPESVSVTPEAIVPPVTAQLAPASTVNTPKLVKLVPNPEIVPVPSPAA